MKTKFTATIIFWAIMATLAKSQSVSESFGRDILGKFEKKVKSSRSNNTGILLIDSPSLEVHLKTAVNPDSTVRTNPDQPFHFASIGKTATAILVSILYEKKLIDFEDTISKFIDDSIVNGLHCYKGVEYSYKLKIKHLLNHTSGLPDYYMDKNSSGIRLLDLMTSEPEHSWTPVQTINWAKQQLKPKFKPGEGFHYADTNYELLGLIIEKVTSKKLAQCLHEFLFEPLEMDNTYQIFHSEPKEKSSFPMVDLYYKGVNLSNAKSISMSCASGGIVSTIEDMLKFHKAIVGNKLICKETFEKMCDYVHMGPGIGYGFGIMNFRFPLMPKKYMIWGNSGSIGAFMYYNPAMDIYLIGSFHKINYQVQPIFYILNTLRKINRELDKTKKS